MWAVCITSINHVLKLNGYGRRQAKVNGKRLRFKGWETLVTPFASKQTFARIDFLGQGGRLVTRKGTHNVKIYAGKWTNVGLTS